MENQRLILFAALMFVVFLLWQNWLEFQAKKHPPPAPTVAAAPAGSAAPAGVSAPVPGQDIPTGAPVAGALPGSQALGGGQRVHVTTDLFEIEIDTVGGDLRQAVLGTYPDSVQRPDQPFLLLKDTGPDLFLSLIHISPWYSKTSSLPVRSSRRRIQTPELRKDSSRKRLASTS